MSLDFHVNCFLLNLELFKTRDFSWAGGFCWENNVRLAAYKRQGGTGMGDRGPQSSGASAGEGSQVWVSCHYSYDVGKAMVIKKILFFSLLLLPLQNVAITLPPASLCSG